MCADWLANEALWMATNSSRFQIPPVGMNCCFLRTLWGFRTLEFPFVSLFPFESFSFGYDPQMYPKKRTASIGLGGFIWA